MTLLKAIPIRWAPRSRLGWSYAGPHPGSVIARREEFTAALLRFGATPAESAVAWDALAGLLSEVGRGPVFVALDPSGDRAATLRVVSLTPRLAWHIRTAQLPVELRLAGAAGPERAQHLAAFASMQLGCWLEKHAARIAALGVVAAHRDVPAGLAPVVRPGDVAYGLGVLGQALQNGVADLEDIAILAGGAPFIAFPQLAGIIGADGTAPDAEAALELLQRLRASKGSAAVARAPTPESLNASKLESIVQAGSWTMEHATGQCTWSGGLYALLDIAPAHSPPSYELLSSVVHPDDRRNVAAAWREAHVERAPFELIHRLRLPNGLTKIVLQRAQTSYDVAGSPVQTIGMLVDITREQLTRRKLDAATAKLMAVWEHVPEGLALIDAATGELIEVNPQAEHLLGADQAALAGVHYTKLFPPKRRRAARAAFAAGLSTPARNVESILRNHVPVEISTSGGFRVGAAEMTLASFRDITRRKLLERSTERFAATMAAMVRANAAIVRAASAEELLRLVCESIVGDRYVGALIAEPLHEPRGSARVLATAGPARYFEGLEIGWDVRERSGRGPFGEATRLGRPVTALVSGRDFAPWRKRALACGIGAAIALPIPETAGSPVFVIYAGDAHGFTPGEIALFESLASDIGLGLRALRRSAEVESALGGALAAVVATLEQRDPYTAGHEERVRELCGLIGTELGLESERLRGLCLAASVHDLGKISIPTEILTKPTRLSEVEFAFVRQHPFTGYNILRNIPFRWNVADIVLQHHEYLDGSGYPNGLRGDEILLEARILTVADIVDSMSAFRPYHRPFDLETVMAELTRLASIRLDPRVVEACVRILRSGAFKPALSGICR